MAVKQLKLAAVPVAEGKPRGGEYEPLPSMWTGDDAELLERMLTLSL